jgi:hypothetical protein
MSHFDFCAIYGQSGHDTAQGRIGLWRHNKAFSLTDRDSADYREILNFSSFIGSGWVAGSSAASPQVKGLQNWGFATLDPATRDFDHRDGTIHLTERAIGGTRQGHPGI